MQFCNHHIMRNAVKYFEQIHNYNSNIHFAIKGLIWTTLSGKSFVTFRNFSPTKNFTSVLEDCK